MNAWLVQHHDVAISADNRRQRYPKSVCQRARGSCHVTPIENSAGDKLSGNFQQHTETRATCSSTEHVAAYTTNSKLVRRPQRANFSSLHNKTLTELLKESSDGNTIGSHAHCMSRYAHHLELMPRARVHLLLISRPGIFGVTGSRRVRPGWCPRRRCSACRAAGTGLARRPAAPCCRHCTARYTTRMFDPEQYPHLRRSRFSIYPDHYGDHTAK